MKNAALCEALPLLATCSHEIPPTPHTVCFAFPPRIITIPEQTHTFEFASRRAASLSLTHACCVSSLAPGHNNSPEIKTNLLLSHLFLFFSFFLPRYYRLSKLSWPSLSAVLFCSHVHCQFPHFFPLLLYINFSTWKKWLEE
ncbi:BAG_1a_G0054200.mRNA.1.CDS.1 [Saccharomyces cerevisiae]|nr:SX2_G0019230.mRNA.1.CDS.1 [Saccharomyces cerevisiae]CAI4807194.1 BAG_1a_G0054200.mRNA.1.CDS.1 [Saccharomyces cerevisiae]CAI7356940.1 BAG_1a_G0054200.mRNA.1.CDS.1 [Saccharomyces cerevisiae]